MAIRPVPPTTTEWALYTRDARRHRLPEAARAYFEFVSPDAPGELWRFPLFEVSWGGLSFELLTDVPGVGPGATLSDGLACIGRASIRGALHVLHVSTVRDGPALCGGRFRPAGPDDERVLERLLERLQRVEAWSLSR